MRTSKILAVVCACAVIFTACNDETHHVVNNSMEVEFASGITTMPKMKVAADNQGNSTWNQGDHIGIYMVGNGGTTVAENVENIQYTATTAGTSTSFNTAGTTIYYPVNTPTQVDFIAYHPYNAAVSNWIYPVNLTVQTPQTNIDLMWAKANNSGAGYDKNYGATVNFTFTHQLVKLVMNISKGAGVIGNVSTVSIEGMNTTASFDLTGTNGLTEVGSPASIAPQPATDGSKYEAILLPLASLTTAQKVEFTVGTDVYVWAMSNNISSLEAGSIYVYDITLTKHEVSAIGNIQKWIVGSTGTAIAD